jgi:2-iminobutanoate/2-iminopropanoate deaminase
MEIITSAHAPPAGGHYSHAVAFNGLIFLSGQLPVPASGGDIPATLEAQTRLVLKNVENVLKATGAALSDVVSATVYVSDISHWPEVNRVYAEVFGSHRPARTVAVSPQLHLGCQVEMQIVARDAR